MRIPHFINPEEEIKGDGEMGRRKVGAFRSVDQKLGSPQFSTKDRYFTLENEKA